MIRPTVGRVVLYRPTDREDIRHAAIVTAVFGAECVNLCVFDENGMPYQRGQVVLVQDDAVPENGQCEWMPYQKGQAARNEELEKAMVDAATHGTGITQGGNHIPISEVADPGYYAAIIMATPEKLATMAEDFYLTEVEALDVFGRNELDANAAPYAMRLSFEPKEEGYNGVIVEHIRYEEFVEANVSFDLKPFSLDDERPLEYAEENTQDSNAA